MVISSTFKSAAAIFLFALLVRICFNFQGEHINAFSSADAAEYLRYATAISKLNWLSPEFTPEWKEFVISGPAFPFALWLFDAVTQFLTTFKIVPFNPLNSITPLIFQSIISALTCVFIYISTIRLFNQPAAIAAAIISIFYPGFIVNSGRLYSETFATFLECACFMLFAITVKPEADQEGKENTGTNWLPPFLLGACLVALQLTRSAMLLFTGATFAFVLASAFLTKSKRNLAPVLGLACGLVLSIAPWLVFQNQAFHKTSLVVDRVGQYNLFIGTNTKIQGFLSYPYPDGRGIENKSFGTLIKEAYKESPNAFLRLMMDKPARLYKFPWNDYRAPILFFDTPWQIAYHQWLLLLAVLGLPLGFMFWTKSQAFGRLYLLMAFAINLPYLAFITVPRYNLAAIPILIIFAGLAITTLTKLLANNSRWAKISLMSGLFLLVYLRDDVTALGFFASSTIPGVNLLSVQPQAPWQKGIIAALAGTVMFVSLFKLLLVEKAGKVSRSLTALAALAILPLVAIPQRANGRFGEHIITIDAPQEIKIKGQIEGDEIVPAAANARPVWASDYLVIDADKGQILDSDVKILVNGVEQKSPLIPGLAAIDDWNYLKVRSDGFTYLECAYIFDCMTQALGKTNLDVRQWYYLHIDEGILKNDAPVQIEIVKKASPENGNGRPLSIFAARPHKDLVLKPDWWQYSWEKAFYGVENDRGLTDSRYDAKVPIRQKSLWTIESTNPETKRKVETPLTGLDLNIHLIKQKSGTHLYDDLLLPPLQASGREDITLSVTPELKKHRQQMLEIEVLYDKNYSTKEGLAARQEARPTLELTFTQTDKATGEKRNCFMPLTWLKEDPACRKIALPLSLDLVPGEDLKIRLKHPQSQLRLVLRPIQ